jgi:hypothetical protein
MTEEQVSYSMDLRRIEKMIHVRMGDALHNPSVLTDKYFIDFCTMLSGMEEISFNDIYAIEKSAGCPRGTFVLWCDGSSLPPEGVLRINMTIDILKELEYRLLPAQ